MNLIRIALPLLGLLAVVALVGVEAGRDPVADGPTRENGASVNETSSCVPGVDGGGPEACGREGSWFAEALNPSHTCPNCHSTYSENRSMLMLLIGFVGQLFFTSRFLVQWIASERRKRSYFPRIFWYLSIAGSLLLFTYSVSILAWPVIFGQALGILVYSRNLALIHCQAQNEQGSATERIEAGGTEPEVSQGGGEVPLGPASQEEAMKTGKALQTTGTLRS
jgi:lipid-A-disaccharide synthase-like uncharacterized protein